MTKKWILNKSNSETAKYEIISYLYNRTDTSVTRESRLSTLEILQNSESGIPLDNRRDSVQFLPAVCHRVDNRLQTQPARKKQFEKCPRKYSQFLFADNVCILVHFSFTFYPQEALRAAPRRCPSFRSVQPSHMLLYYLPEGKRSTALCHRRWKRLLTNCTYASRDLIPNTNVFLLMVDNLFERWRSGSLDL